MRYLAVLLFLFFISFPFQRSFAEEYTFTNTDGSILKVKTTTTTATVSITSNHNYAQRFFVNIWKSRETNTVTGELLEQNKVGGKEIAFNTPPPRTDSLTVTNLSIGTTYYMSVNERPGSAPFSFSTNSYKLLFDPTGNWTYSLFPGNQPIGELSKNVAFQAPSDDQREMLLMLTSTTDVNNVKAVPLGKIISSIGYGGKTVASPSGQSGDWYYTALYARNADNSTEKLVQIGRGELIQFGKEIKIYYTPFGASSFVSDDGRMKISGGPIDVSRHPDFKSFKVKFEYIVMEKGGTGFSEDPTQSLSGALPREPAKNLEENAPYGIADDGTYYFNIGNLTKGATYYFRQIITAPSGIYAVQTGTFYNDSRGFLPPGSNAAQNDFEKRSYRLLAPFPGLSVLLDPDLCREKQIENPGGGQICDINEFLNYIFRLMIGAAAVMLVIRLIMEGYQYIVTDVPFLKVSAKAKIGQAALGLVLALSAWILLNTINPKLVENDISIQGINLELGEGNSYRLQQTWSSASAKVFKRTSYYDKAKTVAAQFQIPHCLLQVVIQRESGGNPTLVGHDENAPVQGVSSRKNFIASGKKFSGAAFTGSITDNKVLNDDHRSGDIYSASNPSADDLGLDWRFSHGIGLTQVTFFPQGSTRGANYNVGIFSKTLNKYLKPKDLFNPDNSLIVAAELLSSGYKECSGDVAQTFTVYGIGDCTYKKPNQLLDGEIPIRKNLYDQCVAQQ